MDLKWCTKLDVVQKKCPIVFRDRPWNFTVTRSEKLTIWIQFEITRPVAAIKSLRFALFNTPKYWTGQNLLISHQVLTPKSSSRKCFVFFNDITVAPLFLKWYFCCYPAHFVMHKSIYFSSWTLFYGRNWTYKPLISNICYIDFTWKRRHGVSWCHKVQQLVQINNKEHAKAPHYWHLWINWWPTFCRRHFQMGFLA